MPSFVADYVAVGYSVMMLAKENGEYSIRYLPAENYTEEGGRKRTLRLYVKEVRKTVFDSGRVERYVFEQEYLPGKIENRLYKCKESFSEIATTVPPLVPLDTIEETSGLKDVEVTGIAGPNVYVVKDSNYRMLSECVSMFDVIRSLVYSIDRKIVMLDSQFLLNTESILLLKNIILPAKVSKAYNEGRTVRFGDIGRVVNGQDDASIEFVANRNELVDTAIKYEEQQIRRISAVTKLPIEFLGIESNAGNVGEGTRTLMHGAFVKQIEGIRSLFSEALSKIASDAGQDTEPSFPDVIAKSENELLDELSKARELRIISQLSAMKAYLRTDDEGAEAEMKLIEEEEAEETPEPTENRNPNPDEGNDRTEGNGA